MSLLVRPTETSENSPRERLRTQIQRCETLPTASGVVRTLMSLTADLNCSLVDVEDIIKTDPSCIARLLYIGNSALYGSNRTVIAPRRLILMFGLNAIREMAQTLTALPISYGPQHPAIILNNRFRLHALAVAVLASYIVKNSSQRIDPEVAFTVGLLHDLGQLLLWQLFPEEYTAAYEETWHLPEFALLKKEMELFEVTHTTVGQWFAEQWHFPPPVLQIISEHHATHLTAPLGVVIQLADTLVHLHQGEHFDATAASTTESLCKTLNLPSRHLKRYSTYLEAEWPRLEQVVKAGGALR